jgi:hypothetical protein
MVFIEEEEVTAKAQRDAKEELFGEILDETFDFVSETDGVEVDEKT